MKVKEAPDRFSTKRTTQHYWQRDVDFGRIFWLQRTDLLCSFSRRALSLKGTSTNTSLNMDSLCEILINLNVNFSGDRQRMYTRNFPLSDTFVAPSIVPRAQWDFTATAAQSVSRTLSAQRSGRPLWTLRKCGCDQLQIHASCVVSKLRTSPLRQEDLETEKESKARSPDAWTRRFHSPRSWPSSLTGIDRTHGADVLAGIMFDTCKHQSLARPAPGLLVHAAFLRFSHVSFCSATKLRNHSQWTRNYSGDGVLFNSISECWSGAQDDKRIRFWQCRMFNAAECEATGFVSTQKRRTPQNPLRTEAKQ